MAGPTWQCSDCDTYNDAAERTCHVCETPRSAVRRDAPEPPAAKKAAPRKPAGTKKAVPAKKAAGARKAAPKKTTAAKKSTPARKASTAGKSAAAKRTPAHLRLDVTGTGGPTVPGLAWECPVCSYRVVDSITCDRCGALWSATARSLHEAALAASGPAPVRPPPREATRGEMVAGCGCLLFIAAVIITPIVLLILNWSTVTSFVTGSDSSKPSPTASASGPCPKPMAEMLPGGSGARLVAAYSRDDLEERYAFCRTTSGEVFYFARMKDGEPYGDPTEVRESEGGYVVDFMPQGTSYHFRGGEVTAYDEDGKELWKGELIPEAKAD